MTITWKDRARGSDLRTETISGVEVLKRFLRHVLPHGLKAIRHYGLNHPSARAQRERVAFHSVSVHPAPC